MTPEFITQQLWKAAQQRNACKIKIRNEFFVRIIHPYGVCRTARNKIVIVCWQEDGPWLAQNETGYRNLLLEKCEGVEILARTFEVQQDFNPDESTYKEWVFHI